MPDLLAPRSRVATKRKPRLLAAAGALALLAAAPADQPDAPAAPPEMKGQPMAFVGVGALTSCAGFLRAAATERDQRPPDTADPNQVRTALYGALMAWADGYLTAKNEDELLHRVTGNTTTLAQRGRWLELFCQANPDATFFAAVFKLREHLVAEGL
jgi:hypothetical protein